MSITSFFSIKYSVENCVQQGTINISMFMQRIHIWKNIKIYVQSPAQT